MSSGDWLVLAVCYLAVLVFWLLVGYAGLRVVGTHLDRYRQRLMDDVDMRYLGFRMRVCPTCKERADASCPTCKGWGFVRLPNGEHDQ